MDPNEALKNVREAVGELWHQDDDGTLDETSQVGFLLASFEALDEWLTKGGFLPHAWSHTSDQFFVEIIYNTDPHGQRVDEDDYSNRTLHGPFTSEGAAHQWLDTRTDGDKDVRDVIIGVLNKADPDRPYANVLPGEPEQQPVHVKGGGPLAVYEPGVQP